MLKKVRRQVLLTGGTAYSPLAYLKRPYFRRSKACPLEQCANEDIDYKNKALLSKFTSEYGRILPSRITSVSSRKQRLLSTAIKKGTLSGSIALLLVFYL